MLTTSTRPEHSPREIYRRIRGKKKEFWEGVQMLRAEHYLMDDPEEFAALVRDVRHRLSSAAPNKGLQTIWRQRLAEAVEQATGKAVPK